MKRTVGYLAFGLAAFFAAMDLSAADTNETARLVSADLRQTNGPLDTMFKFCVGAGRANEGLRADWQRQLTYAHRECGFQYVRMHGLFTDDMGVSAAGKSKSSTRPREREQPASTNLTMPPSSP